MTGLGGRSRSVGAEPGSGGLRVPGAVVERLSEPDSVAGVGEAIAEARGDGAGLLIAGGGTRLHWANPARRISLALSTLGLSGIDAFEPEEGVLHASAGTPLATLREAALAEGWELPLDAPGASSTLGGVLATGANGPRAHAFGRVADAVLGLEVVGADGVASKCGGRVVKNVTGYDLAKLYCGSFGTLGVVTGAWLRLRPRPGSQRAFTATLGADEDGFDRCRRFARLGAVRALVWSVEAGGDAARLDLELAAGQAESEHDRDRIARTVDLEEMAPARIDALRDARAEVRGDAVVLRLRALGTRLWSLVEAVRAAGLGVEVDLGRGQVHARGALGAPEALLGLRAEAERLGGFAQVEVMPEAWRTSVDVFGGVGPARASMLALKRRFDPDDVLNPGRFVAGI